MALDKIKRSFQWLRKSLEIIDRTTLPGEILGEVRPTIDTFGWEKLAGLSGTVPQRETVEGPLAGNNVLLSVVPEGIMRYVIYLSASHNDSTPLAMSLQVRGGGMDIAIDKSSGVASGLIAQPIRYGLERNILLQPGEQIICRAVPDPGVSDRLTLRYKFIDLFPGEYIPAI